MTAADFRTRPRPTLKSRLTHLLIRAGDPSARLRAGAALELYYEVGDAHSHLCARWLAGVRGRLRVPLRIRPVPAPAPETYPEAARQRAFAREDVRRLAPCVGLELRHPPAEPDPALRATVERRLAALAGDPERFLTTEAELIPQLWAGRVPAGGAGAAAPAAAALLRENALRRQRLGHYLPAMWQFGGRWFWALERLPWLERALRARGLLDGAAPLIERQPQRLPAPTPAADDPLEVFFSFRSPYSYLALVELARRGAGDSWPLRLRPVLPMVMRGLTVPRAKRMYIAGDAARCARELNIAFGHVHDPLGAGVLRLLAAYPWSAAPEVQLRYAVAAGRAVWAEGVNVAEDAGLRHVLEHGGLDGTHAAGDEDTALAAAEDNRRALQAIGLWGVPSFHCGGFATWGQDRLWMIDELRRRQRNIARAAGGAVQPGVSRR
ncbi:MAG: DsbA family protein [Gammaproteobacteria bacterium]|nr:DsbA family protein [Gammaproteobacteria bacterium]